MNIASLFIKFPLLFITFALTLTACSSWSSNKGVIILDLRDKTHTYVKSQDLPNHYKLGTSEQELQRFETFCEQEIKISKHDGSEEAVFENIKHGVHGQVEFKKCSDKITRIYQY
ncbi:MULTISPECIES: hypothetical protein [unclassified Gilliamella]|uniref:hypothetical protein n=1 Tax=unclassified Gilliamella TaxID=2685620 RepID=UPI00226ACEEB|nr:MULTISPECIES: hypothetical protein [unclassified Gilliamella]MCX8642817.1 hypothetical protein [Gilliamella sp. B3835]MCX8708224.1 hypothetical protein [Gilliamella sp. B3783]MCX8710122.1 hypothetical protein [Gilliamella sp. B3780]MCX8712712.1 hypothetical protein [Gilliamella sp. B3468]MCX8715398.1 hypothetical protein [Gilliamella sp. B3781]